MADSDRSAAHLTSVQWLICIIASIGFAFDIYELLMLPLIVRPALMELGGLTPGTPEFATWAGRLFYVPAIAGGIFGLLGGYLTDLLGRRLVLTWSILLYAFAAFAAGFSTNLYMLLFFRCLVFVGVCVEFVAAVAWLAELFDDPHRRERVLGYTQAFSSIGGLLVATANAYAIKQAANLPEINLPEWLNFFGGDIKEHHAAWRYTLMSGLLPAIPLILIRPFLPESPKWKARRDAGTLRRPSIRELFEPALAHTTIITTLMFACSFGAAFGAIQQVQQIVPGLPEVKSQVAAAIAKEFPPEQAPPENKTPENTPAEGQADKGQADKEQADKEQPSTEQPSAEQPGAKGSNNTQPKTESGKSDTGNTEKKTATKGSAGKEAGDAAKKRKAKEGKIRAPIEQSIAARVTSIQEIGGLVGRFLLAVLAVRIVSRRSLLRVFQFPGLFIMPIVFAWAAVTSLTYLQIGIFLAGLLTVAQFSFWGNYLPRVYPVHLRGTGESFAANIGGRLIGTSFAWVTQTLAVMSFVPGVSPPEKIAYTAAGVSFALYLVGSILCFFLPEPKAEDME